MRSPPRPSQIVREVASVTTPQGQHVVVTLERMSTGGTRREAAFMRSAAGTMSEAERGRKKRAKKSLFREQKRKLSRLDYENIIVETIDPDNPADGIMESLEERMRKAKYSQRQDVQDAANVLRAREGDSKELVAASVHLMVGPKSDHRWTLCGKERIRCEQCGRVYSRRPDGSLRRHTCG